MSDPQNLRGPASATKGFDKSAGGFFTIQRQGQGKWTRLGTAMVSGALILGTGLFIYTDVRANVGFSEKTALIAAGGFILVVSLLVFWVQNTPNNVAFLIDTDSEMKKVNWTSRQEIIGSTKIVIGFMLIMSAMLFFVDIVFGYLFYAMGVLKFSPGIFDMFRK